MSWHVRIIIIFITFFAFLYYVGMSVLPVHSYNINSAYKNRQKDDIKYNDDKINTVITNITSSTPISVVAASSQYIKLNNKYSIPPIGKAIVANLDDKTVALVEDSKIIQIYNIVSIGKPNKYYETPGGIYKIRSWETNHYSSIGHVYMPWSMQFSGNYFIHGIPYYENGEKVSSQYSGGCIRLSDEAAKTVYDFSDKNTYVVVIKNEDLVSDTKTEDYDKTLMDTIKNNLKDSKYLILDLKDSIYFSNIGDLNKTLNDSKIENMAIAMTALDYVSQEKKAFIDSNEIKQLDLLPEIIKGNKKYIDETINPLGHRLFQAFLNNKIKSIGLENTDIDLSASSTENINNNSKARMNISTSTLLDMMYIYRYTYIYKPYLMSLDNTENTDRSIIWQMQNGKYNIKILKGSDRDFLIISY